MCLRNISSKGVSEGAFKFLTNILIKNRFCVISPLIVVVVVAQLLPRCGIVMKNDEAPDYCVCECGLVCGWMLCSIVADHQAIFAAIKKVRLKDRKKRKVLKKINIIRLQM